MQRRQWTPRDDYGDNEIDDNELLNMPLGDLDFDDIDNFANVIRDPTQDNTFNNKPSKGKDRARPVDTAADDSDEQRPVQLDNGKWACNHKCKDKTACKHICCRVGIDKPPKKPAKKATHDKNASQPASQMSNPKDKKLQTKLQLTATKRKNPQAVEELDLTQPEKKSKCDPVSKNPEYRRLEHLHQSIQKNKPTTSASTIFPKRSEQTYDESGQGLSFLQQPLTSRHETSSDYGDINIDEFPPEPSNNENKFLYTIPIPAFTAAVAMDHTAKAPVTSRQSDKFDYDNDSLLSDAMVGLADSQNFATTPTYNNSGVQFSDEPAGIDYEYEAGLHDDDFPMSIESADLKDSDPASLNDNILAEFNDIVPGGASHIERTPHDLTLTAPPHPSSTHLESDHFQPGSANIDYPAPHNPHDPVLKGTSSSSSPSSSTANHRQASDKSWDYDASIFDMLSESAEVQDGFQPGDRDPNGGVSKRDCDVLDAPKQHDVLASAVKKEQIPDDFKDLKPWLFEEFGDIVEIDDD